MRRLVPIVVLAAALAVQGLRAQEPARLLRAAMNAELVNGDFAVAIEQYKQVARGGDRSSAAAAQVRLGELYRKLGDEAASRAAFETVARDFADQPEAVAAARARLENQVTSPSGTGLDAIQLWHGLDIEGDAALSPDGRHLVYSSWAENGNFVLKDLATGESRTITDEARVRTGGPSPYGPAFSPDGSRIAYAWYEAEGKSSLRVMDRDGTNVQVIVDDAADFPYAWSPDGRTIAFNQYAAGQSRIVLASVADGAVEPLLSTAWLKAQGGHISASGRFLVYAIDPGDDEPGGVYTLAIDGTAKTRLGAGTAATWTPDGDAVVFVSGRGGSSALWLQPVVEGRPAGEPTILRPNTNAGFLRFTDDGSLFYGFRNAGKDVVVATLDLASGGSDEPRLFTDAFVGSNGSAIWSPDGRLVAMGRGPDRTAPLVVRTAGTGEERPVSSAAEGGVTVPFQGGRWFPDNRHLLTHELRRGFWKVDVETGSRQIVLAHQLGGAARIFDLSPDGRFLFYVRREGEGVPPVAPVHWITRREIDTGDELRLLQSDARRMAVSPDGAWLAVLSELGVALLPTNGGEPVVIQPRARGVAAFLPMAWTPDGQYVLGTRAEDGRDWLWAMPAGGGEGVRFDISALNILTVSVSPTDGRVLVSRVDPSEELWLVRNLLPSSPAR